MLIKELLFLLFFLSSLNFSQQKLVVRTKYGKVQGYYRNSFTNRTYEAFEGIPFALPPTRNRRFEPPEPAKPWSGELIANRIRGPCYELYEIPNSLVVGTSNKIETLSGVEDCLYLNVYAPINRTEPLPVIFWIYGGGFQGGFVNGYEQQYLIDKNVIFVSSNYRHGVLGFMSTEDDVVPGNMGLKDQSLALRWVHENIQQFGGDRNRITLLGVSSGAVSVHFHYLSPMSAGLFHSGISLSGTALNAWSLARGSRDKAILMAKLVNCSTINSRAMVSCLKRVSLKDLQMAQLVFALTGSFIPFAPVVESNSEVPFISQTPLKIMKSGGIYDVPWITGIVSDEGAGFVEEFAKNQFVLKIVDKSWNLLAPRILFFDRTIPKNQKIKVSQQIKRHYFGNESVSIKNLGKLSLLANDRLFSVDAQKAAKLQARVNKSPVWFYLYSHKTSTNSTGLLQKYRATHGDDARIVLGSGSVDALKTDSDKAMRRELGKMWTEFARNGTPMLGSRWDRVKKSISKTNYLYIRGPSKYQMLVNGNLGDRRFWDSIYFHD